MPIFDKGQPHPQHGASVAASRLVYIARTLDVSVGTLVGEEAEAGSQGQVVELS